MKAIKTLLKITESISDSIYSFFYNLKIAKLGYILTTPLYLIERLLILVWDQIETKA